MKKVVDYLRKAKLYAANALEEQYISKYIESFETGTIDALF